MGYHNLSKEQLILKIEELERFNKQLLEEKVQEDRLNLPWTGNLGHWYLNIKTNSVTFNPLKVTTLGYTTQEIPEVVNYQFFTDKLHPDDYQNTMNVMLSHLQGKSSVYEVQYKIQTKNGSWRWYYDIGRITQYDDEGKPLLISGIVFDITDRKETEIHLQEAKTLAESQSKKWNTLFQNITEGVIVADSKGNMLNMNTVALRMHGLNSLDEFVHYKDFGIDFEVFSLDGRPMPPEEWAMSRVLRGEVFTDYKMWVCRKDINLRWIGSYGGSPIYNENGEMTMALITLRDITDETKLKDALNESETKYRNLFNNMEHGHSYYQIITDEGGKAIDFIITDVNPAYEKITGLSYGELVGKKATDLFPNIMSTNADWINLFGEVALKGNPISMETYSDIMDKWYSVNYYCPKPGYIACIFSDFTIRKNNETNLEKTNQRLLESQTLSHIGDWEFDLINNQIYWSDELYRIYGLEPQSFIPKNKTSHEYVHPDDLEYFKNAELGLLSGTVDNIEFRYKGINNKTGWINVKSKRVLNEEGKLILLKGTVQDITERKILEQEISQQRNELEVIIQNINDAIIITDNKGNITKMNAEALKLYTEFDNKATIKDIHNKSQYFDLDNNIFLFENLPSIRALQGEKVRNESVIIKQTEITHFTEISATPIFDNNENLVSVLINHHDISESVKHQQEITKQHEYILKVEKEKVDALSKAIEMKDEFLSLISHEFKTPLTVINSAIQAMEVICKNDLSDKAKDFLNKIRQNSNRQLKLVNNLLDITRMNAGHLKINKKDFDIVFLSRAITNSISIFAEQKGINLSFTSTFQKKVIGIDDEKYERILLNLLSNAIKFTPKGKSITVKVSQKIVKGKCKVCIKVRDEGVGIPDNKKELIFERFEQVDSSLTRQAEGSGIGLSLVKMMVELLGGEIALESKEGVGSTFTILLPIEKAKETPIERMIEEINDNRLIQALNIEFSDIYIQNH